MRGAENQRALNSLFWFQGQAKWILKNKLGTPFFSLIPLGYLGYFTLHKAFSFIFVCILMFLPDLKSSGLFAEGALPCKLASSFWYFIVIFLFFRSSSTKHVLGSFSVHRCFLTVLISVFGSAFYSHGSSVHVLWKDIRCRISENAFSGNWFS